MIALRILGVIVAVVAIAGVGFMLAMRAKYEPVQTAVRRINKTLWNPRALEHAGTPGANASIIRHVGRNSGTAYETPVGAYHADDAIYVALPYGPTTDWIRNLTAAGGGEVVHEGVTYTVGAPAVVPMDDVVDIVPSGEQRTLRAFKVDEVLSLPVVEARDRVS